MTLQVIKPSFSLFLLSMIVLFGCSSEGFFDQIDEIENNQFESSRKVIDVSGDGRSNNGIHPMSIRDAAIEKGITINGLVILNEEPFLGGYFERSVIGGYGAFMMVAEDYRDYAAMILQKLLREIGLPVS